MRKIEYFGANWCVACVSVKPIVQNLKNVDVEYIDVEQETQRAVELGIRSIPVIRVLNDDGSEKTRLVGKVTEEQITQHI